MTRCDLLILETHPIQYRAPIYQELQKLCPDRFQVVYASDFSIKGYADAGFGAHVAWDVPLLSGYPNRVLGNDAAGGIERWHGLTGKGVAQLFQQLRPRAVLLSSYGYRFNWAAVFSALRFRIPLWIRMETQDDANRRGLLKRIVRHIVYRLAYTPVARAFYIGELNREHLIRHGVLPSRMSPALYCTPDPFQNMPRSEKAAARSALRCELGVPEHHHVVGFFGKLIPKKDPGAVLDAVAGLGTARNSITCLFVGTGELGDQLKIRAEKIQQTTGIKSIFVGFVNQSALPRYYLACDTVVLPSRRSGETWGLVVNEALQAGCNVVLSEGVGCGRDFGDWPRVRIVPIGAVDRLGQALTELMTHPRDFDWAQDLIARYSVRAAAEQLAAGIRGLDRAVVS